MTTNIENYLKNLTFYNTTVNNLTFDDVTSYIIKFIKGDPKGIYTLAIGSDSQVKTHSTVFVSAIMIYRLGKGAWGCMSKYSINRRIDNLREKISIETFLTQQIAYKFTGEFFDKVFDLIIPYIDKGAEFHHEVHIDIGHKGETKKLINEMTSYFAGMGFEPKIKPESFVASGYANKFTK